MDSEPSVSDRLFNAAGSGRLIGAVELREYARKVYELETALHNEQTATAYWHRKAQELEETVREFEVQAERRVEDGDY